MRDVKYPKTVILSKIQPSNYGVIAYVALGQKSLETQRALNKLLLVGMSSSPIVSKNKPKAIDMYIKITKHCEMGINIIRVTILYHQKQVHILDKNY